MWDSWDFVDLALEFDDMVVRLADVPFSVTGFTSSLLDFFENTFLRSILFSAIIRQ